VATNFEKLKFGGFVTSIPTVEFLIVALLDSKRPINLLM
jgi:hypothetical protein